MKSNNIQQNTPMKIIKFSLFFSAILILNACSKEDLPTTQPAPAATNAPTTATPTPNFATVGPAGVCFAIKSFVDVPPVGGFEFPTIEVGTVGASFWDENANTLVDAGAINCNEKSLAKYENNSYLFVPSASEIAGIDLQSGSTWNVAGAATVASFNYNNTQPIPLSEELQLAESATKTQPLLVSVGTVVYADSVQFQIADSEGHSVLHVEIANTGSTTFTPTELSTLTSGQMSVVVAPYNYILQTFERPIFFVNITTRSKIMTLE